MQRAIYLNGKIFTSLIIIAFKHLAKGPFPKVLYNLVAVHDMVSFLEGILLLFVDVEDLGLSKLFLFAVLAVIVNFLKC